jgi:hypothetical protein
VAWGIINDGTIHNYKELVFPRLTQSKTDTNQYITAWAKKAGIEKRIGWHTAPAYFRGTVPGIRGRDLHGIKITRPYEFKKHPGIRKGNRQNEAGSSERAAGY